jgi:VIT1/CCC1 family predicted Fe2+/Mn2+ transporter
VAEQTPSDLSEVPGAAHADERHGGSVASRLNWLRAAVLGANDGIVSIAGLVAGVAGATTDRGTLLLTGIAGLVAGALSMAGGEYVSVATQRDAEEALLELERWELREMPEAELEELTALYEAKGLSRELARQVAEQLTEHDALGAHAEVELGIDPDELTSPMVAAISSMIAFALGAALPLLSIVLPPPSLRFAITIAAVVVSLAITGDVSARLGRARPFPAMVRNVGVGILTMGIGWVIGSLVGASAL